MTIEITNIKNETLTKVETQISDLQKNGGLNFPANYSVGNALKSAWLILQETVDKDKKPVLETCTKESICLSLLDMTIQGLSASKKQGYFIAYGKKLAFSRSYFGTIAVTKRLKEVKDIVSQVIFEGDDFAFEIKDGVKSITKHTQTLDSINNATGKIKGAYCIITREDGAVYTDIMPFAMIQKSWSKTKMKENNVQRDFSEDMAKRTVINRACKFFVNTSDDSDLIINSFDRSTEKSVDDVVIEQIQESANSEVIDITCEVKTPDAKQEVKPKQEVIPEQERKPEF